MSDSDSEQAVVELDLPLATGPAQNLFSAHKYLRKLLALDPLDTLMLKIFDMLAALCDPLTQPEDSDRVPLSVAVLSDVAILLAYKLYLQHTDKRPKHTALARFAVSLKFFAILQAINAVLRADDELRVRYLQNDTDQWQSLAHFWLPQVPKNETDASLKLLYYLSCVLVMSLYRLFLPEDGSAYNAALNPYLDYLLRLWKTHTSIIALALEMDRELEEMCATGAAVVETPDLVKKALLGLLVVRMVLAWILDQVAPLDKARGALLASDLHDESLLDIYDPLARRAKCCGAIEKDARAVMFAVLVWRAGDRFTPTAYPASSDFPKFDEEDYASRLAKRADPVSATGDLIVDLYYLDQFDEDIKYVFGHYDSDSEHEDDDASSVASDDLEGMARRLKRDEIEFDADGRDWRDKARGANTEFSEYFLLSWEENPDDFGYRTWFELNHALEFLAMVKIEHVGKFIANVGQIAVNTVARAVMDEQNGRSEITPDEIHRFLVLPVKPKMLMKAKEDLALPSIHPPTHFELIFMRNPLCALAILDELFMCKGMRRLLIWFLTHSVNPLMWLIDYIYELAVGERWTGVLPYLASRKGALEVSKVEQLMALHELFIAAARWCTEDVEEGKMPKLNASRMISYLCLMLDRLLALDVIRTEISDSFEDYRHDIQMLLVPWIGSTPDARRWFFRVFAQAPDAEAKNDKEIQARPGQLKLSTEAQSIVDALALFNPVKIDRIFEEVHRCPELESVWYRRASQVWEAFAQYGQKYLRLMEWLFENPGIALFWENEYALALTADICRNYLVYFNDWAKNAPALYYLFALLQTELVGTRPGCSQCTHDGDHFHEGESEFNDDFLNGEGQFREDEGKKKKKKKKKKKSKRK